MIEEVAAIGTARDADVAGRFAFFVVVHLYHAVSTGAGCEEAVIVAGISLVGIAVVTFFDACAFAVAAVVVVAARGFTVCQFAVVGAYPRVFQVGFTLFAEARLNDTITAGAVFQVADVAAAVVVGKISVITFFGTFTKLIAACADTGNLAAGGADCGGVRATDACQAR